LVSYDNVAVAKKKAAFVQQMKLGSMMWWESSADKTGNNCLIQNVTEIVGVDNDPGLDYSPNQLAYPNNTDENLLTRMPESSSFVPCRLLACFLLLIIYDLVFDSEPSYSRHYHCTLKHVGIFGVFETQHPASPK